MDEHEELSAEIYNMTLIDEVDDATKDAIVDAFLRADSNPPMEYRMEDSIPDQTGHTPTHTIGGWVIGSGLQEVRESAEGAADSDNDGSAAATERRTFARNRQTRFSMTGTGRFSDERVPDFMHLDKGTSIRIYGLGSCNTEVRKLLGYVSVGDVDKICRNGITEDTFIIVYETKDIIFCVDGEVVCVPEFGYDYDVNLSLNLQDMYYIAKATIHITDDKTAVVMKNGCCISLTKDAAEDMERAFDEVFDE